MLAFNKICIVRCAARVVTGRGASQRDCVNDFILSRAKMGVHVGLKLVLAGLLLCAAGQDSAFAASQDCSDKMGVKRSISVSDIPRPEWSYSTTDLGLQDGEVILTFDDGPSPSATLQVLDILEEECLKATFFMLGRKVSQHPEMVDQIVKAGHSVGSHTFSHPRLPRLSIGMATTDVQLGYDILETTLGKPALLFRYPFFAASEALQSEIEARGMRPIGADISGNDWSGNRCEESSALIRKQLEAKGRGIILMHDSEVETTCQLRMVLAELKKQNLSVVHLLE